MRWPTVFPEPSFYRLSGGSVRVREGTESRRGLTPADVEEANQYFGTCLREESLPAAAYWLRVNAEGIEIAARSAEGFAHALETMRQVSGTRGGQPVSMARPCVVFDFPCKRVRAVHLEAAGAGDVAALSRLLPVMARLRYNTLYVGAGLDGLARTGGGALAALASASGIEMLPDSRLPEGVIDGLEGPSVLDWEHVSRRPGVDGAAVRYGGPLGVDEMARSGFLFNLVYAAQLLWTSGYDNFAWERAVDPAQEAALGVAAELLGHDPKLEASDTEDTYPVALHGRIAEKADRLIFRHALASPAPSAPAQGGRPRQVGSYSIRYADGTSAVIPLREDLDIGREDLWPGRRYDAWNHRFETERRLWSLACFTRPVKWIDRDGRLRFRFDLDWANPHPDRLIEGIDIEGHRVTVEAIRVVHAGA